MPDLTIENYQMCASINGPKSFQESGYQQYNMFSNTSPPHCTCPAFKFNKSRNKGCKHIDKIYKEVCRWHGAYSDTIQDEEQERGRTCPVCGGPTTFVRVAV